MMIAGEPGASTRASTTAMEVPVYIPSQGEHLGAVVTLPEHPPVAPLGVVLMAGRARDRALRNGLWVRVAEALSVRGMYALRLDYPGVGNSSGPPQVFDLEQPPGWAIRDACEFLLRQTSVKRIALVGSCFGGRVALRAASEIPEVRAIAIVAAPTHARTRSRRLRLRLKLARLRDANDPAVKPARAALQRREGGLPLEARVSPGFAHDIRRFLRRGTVYFLYGERDYSLEELRFALERLKLPTDRYDVEVVPGEMHSFRTLAVQQLTVERLAEWCSRFVEEAPEINA